MEGFQHCDYTLQKMEGAGRKVGRKVSRKVGRKIEKGKEGRVEKDKEGR